MPIEHPSSFCRSPQPAFSLPLSSPFLAYAISRLSVEVFLGTLVPFSLQFQPSSCFLGGRLASWTASSSQYTEYGVTRETPVLVLPAQSTLR